MLMWGTSIHENWILEQDPLCNHRPHPLLQPHGLQKQIFGHKGHRQKICKKWYKPTTTLKNTTPAMPTPAKTESGGVFGDSWLRGPFPSILRLKGNYRDFVST